MRLIALIIGFTVSAVTAAVVPMPATLPLPLGEISWQGVVNLGEPEVKVWGWSFEEIQAKIREQYNPDFSIYTESVQGVPEVSVDPAVVARSQLEKRNLNCDTRFGQVGTVATEQAVRNLRGIANCGARARHCIRMQCLGQGQAIGLCNDNHHDINIPCSVAADMAQTILNRCVVGDIQCNRNGDCQNSPWNWVSSGQLFSDQHYNVIVGGCGFFGNGERPIKA